MRTENNRSLRDCKISRPEAKFLIGFIAGICATFFPRIIVVLNMFVDEWDVGEPIRVFDERYIVYALLFSILVGAVITILEWHVLCEPGKTFMAALSVPALISGGFNTNNAIDLYKTQQASLAIEQEIQNRDRIPIDLPVFQKDLKQLSKSNVRESRDNLISHFLPALPGPAKAYAATSFAPSSGFLAFKIEERLYIIILDTLPDAQAARDRATELRAHIREAQAVEVGSNEYLVILGGMRLPRTQALMQADELRRRHPNLHLNLRLLPIRSKD